MYTRRAFGKVVLAAVPAMPMLAHAGAAQKVSSKINGVRMGLQSASFTFSGMGIDQIIQTMVDLGLGEIDVMAEHVEAYLGAPGVQVPGTGRPGPWARGARPGGPPAGAPGGAPAAVPGAGPRGAGGFGRGGDPVVREALRKWRLDVSLNKYQAVANKFKDAGLNFFSYNLSFNDSYTDEEISKGMEMAKALGTKILTVSSPMSVLPRVAPLAEKHGVIVALHNHTTGPDEFAQAMALSKNMWVNLDVGHFFATGHDPLAYIRAHHARITNIHVKDRKANNGAEMPFGQGETPLKETLLLVRSEKYDFPVCIEYVGPDGPAVELKRCFDYCKAILKS
ncbi:MAG: sugar phosphate isomerase/epimerase family protein [Vicinamibacterales bacterium]